MERTVKQLYDEIEELFDSLDSGDWPWYGPSHEGTHTKLNQLLKTYKNTTGYKWPDYPDQQNEDDYE